MKHKPICCPPQSPNPAEWSLIFNGKKPFLSPHLLLYPCFTVSSLLTAVSLSSKDSFKSSQFRLQIHNARALTALPSSRCSSPFSCCRFKKTKGRVFNARWNFYGLHVSFSFVFYFSILLIFQPCSAMTTQLKSSSPRASITSSSNQIG